MVFIKLKHDIENEALGLSFKQNIIIIIDLRLINKMNIT